MEHVGSPIGIRPNWQVQRILGHGGEGTAYLVTDVSTNSRSVVKMFHSPRPKEKCRNLQIYAARVTGEYPGLPKLDLLEDEDGVYGIAYEYRPLHRVHHRLWGSLDQLAQAMVGIYCRMQVHLISTAGIVLWDADVVNFLLATDGRFHWIDFGWGVAPIDHPWNLERGHVGYGLAMLLLSVHGVNIKPAVQITPGYSPSEPCRYCMDSRLDTLAAKHRWLRQVLDEVRRQPAMALLEPEFYDRLGARLPDRVAAPRGVIFASDLLRIGGCPWSFLRRSIWGARSMSESRPKERV
jgi:hypothetical protein